MKFTLHVINTAKEDINVDVTFSTMEDLLSFVKVRGHEWTSLVVTVLH